MAKQTTNHQLGEALAELLNDCIKKMRASEASIDQAKNEIKILLDKFMQIERQIYSKIDSSQLQVDTRPLEQVNQEIRKAGEEAGQSIKKTLSSFLLNRYVILLQILTAFISLATILFFFLWYPSLTRERDSLQNFRDNITDYFNENPKEWEKVEKWMKSSSK